jgi:hypothetical protein
LNVVTSFNVCRHTITQELRRRILAQRAIYHPFPQDTANIAQLPVHGLRTPPNKTGLVQNKYGLTGPSYQLADRKNKNTCHVLDFEILNLYSFLF